MTHELYDDLRQVPPPRSVASLLERAVAISGRSVAQVAHDVGCAVPADLRRDKGFIGQLVERALGAPAGNAQAPDFAALGVELKTVPVRANGRPVESTWVTRASLHDAAEQTWATSAVRAKLSCVLWVPVLTEPRVPPADRIIGSPYLWRPNAAQRATLQRDWHDIMERLLLGTADELSASVGDALQLRPKGRSADERAPAVDREGRPCLAQARGFYLRASFTRELLSQAFGLAGASSPVPPPPAVKGRVAPSFAQRGQMPQPLDSLPRSLSSAMAQSPASRPASRHALASAGSPSSPPQSQARVGSAPCDH